MEISRYVHTYLEVEPPFVFRKQRARMNYDLPCAVSIKETASKIFQLTQIAAVSAICY